jgi:hypothetical protein
MPWATRSLSPAQPEEPSHVCHVADDPEPRCAKKIASVVRGESTLYAFESADGRFDHNGVVLSEAYLYGSERWSSTSDINLCIGDASVEVSMGMPVSMSIDESGHADYVRASTAPPGLDGSSSSHGADVQRAEEDVDGAIQSAPSPRTAALARRHTTGCTHGGAASVIQIASVLPVLCIVAEEAHVARRSSISSLEESERSLSLHAYELDTGDQAETRHGDYATSTWEGVQEPEADCCFMPLHSPEVDLGEKAEKSEKSETSDTLRKEATELFGDTLVFVSKGPARDVGNRAAASRGVPTVHDCRPEIAPMAIEQPQDHTKGCATTARAPDLFHWFPGLSQPSLAGTPPPPPPTPPPQPELRTPRGHGLARMLVPPIMLGTGTKRGRLSPRKSPDRVRLAAGPRKSVKAAASNNKQRSSAEHASGAGVISRMRHLMGSMSETPRPRSM